MRLFSGFLISTLALGTIVTTGCAEHRYRGNDPYYRQWLAERRYDNIEYNRLSRERQREYWEWRRQNEARFRQDPRFRDNQRIVRNDHDADDRRRNDHDADDRRGRTYAQTRNGDRDRHQTDRDRHKVRDRDHDKRDKDDHDRDRDRR